LSFLVLFVSLVEPTRNVLQRGAARLIPDVGVSQQPVFEGSRNVIIGSGFTNYVQTNRILEDFGIHSEIRFPDEGITPVGSFLCALLQLLAWEDSSLRGIARYFRLTGISGPGMAALREWPLSVYSAKTRRKVKTLAQAAKADFKCDVWDEWCKMLT
jgi:hypothetical protein